MGSKQVGGEAENKLPAVRHSCQQLYDSLVIFECKMNLLHSYAG